MSCSSEHPFVRLAMSVKGRKTIDARGIERVVEEMRAPGEKV